MTRLLAVLAALPLLAACGADAAAPPRGAPAPAGGPAVGDYVADGLPAPFEEGDALRVTFRDGEISFQATCNTMSGRAAWDDGVLVVSNLGGTEMGCMGAGFDQDEWLVDFFTSSPDVLVDGTDVRLATDDDEIWLVPADELAPDPGPDTALEGTDWRLTGVEEADGDSVGMLGVPGRLGAHLTIRGRELTFGTGCNSGGGTVTVHGDRLTLRGVGITLKGCHGIRGEIEGAQLPVLMATRLDWSITGQDLRLTRGGTSLLYRAAR